MNILKFMEDNKSSSKRADYSNKCLHKEKRRKITNKYSNYASQNFPKKKKKTAQPTLCRRKETKK